MCTLTLTTALMRNLFPDPDAVCSTLQLNHSEWCLYFTDLIAHCFGNKMMKISESQTVTSRNDLLLLIHSYDATTGAPTPETDEEVRLFAGMSF